MSDIDITSEPMMTELTGEDDRPRVLTSPVWPAEMRSQASAGLVKIVRLFVGARPAGGLDRHPPESWDIGDLADRVVAEWDRRFEGLDGWPGHRARVLADRAALLEHMRWWAAYEALDKPLGQRLKATCGVSVERCTPASSAQLHYLLRLGLRVDQAISSREASALIETLRQRSRRTSRRTHHTSSREEVISGQG